MYRTVTEQNNQSLLEKGKVEVRQVHVILGGQPEHESIDTKKTLTGT